MNANLLKALHKTYQELQEELDEVKRMICEERLKLCKADSGFAPGVLVKDKDGQIYRVVDLRFDSSFEETGKPCAVHAHRLQYDGANIKWTSVLEVAEDGVEVIV